MGAVSAGEGALVCVSAFPPAPGEMTTRVPLFSAEMATAAVFMTTSSDSDQPPSIIDPLRRKSTSSN
jgi:hypothetical protein